MSLTRVLSAVVVSGALLFAVPAQAKTTPTPTTHTKAVHHTVKKANKKHAKHTAKNLHAKAAKKAHRSAKA